MSDSRELYDQLRSEGLAGIQRIIREQRPEDLLLEYKRKTDPMTPDLNREDRKVFSKALSASVSGICQLEALAN